MDIFTNKAKEWNKNKVGSLASKKRHLLEGVESARRRRDNQYLVQLEKETWKDYNKLLHERS